MKNSVPARFPNLGDVLDRVTRIYQNHLLLILGVTFLPSLLWFGVTVLITPVSANGVPATNGILGYTYQMLANLISLFTVAMMAQIAAGDLLNHPSSIARMLKNVIQHWGALVVLGLLLLGATWMTNSYSLALLNRDPDMRLGGIPTILLVSIVSSLFIALFIRMPIYFVLQGTILQDLSLPQAIRRAWDLTTHQRIPLLLVALVISIVFQVIHNLQSWLLSFSILYLDLPIQSIFWLFTFASTVVDALLNPIWFCLISVLYLELRIRRENIDLQMSLRAADPNPAA